MRHEFHPEALEEFENAAHYYADCQEGLEIRFVAAVESAIQRIAEAPQRWRIFEEDVRRCLTRVFPFAILYTIEPEGYILIVAVMHCRREPGYWRHRLVSLVPTVRLWVPGSSALSALPSRSGFSK